MPTGLSIKHGFDKLSNTFQVGKPWNHRGQTSQHVNHARLLTQYHIPKDCVSKELISPLMCHGFLYLL